MCSFVAPCDAVGFFFLCENKEKVQLKTTKTFLASLASEALEPITDIHTRAHITQGAAFL